MFPPYRFLNTSPRLYGHQLPFLGGSVLTWLSTATTPIRSAAPMLRIKAWSAPHQTL